MADRYRDLAIILAGGKGIRLGSNIPKQYIEVEGHTILEHTLKAVCMWDEMDSLVIVADEEWADVIDPVVDRVYDNARPAFLGYAHPGEDRQGSILNAMNMVKGNMAEDAVVMIHDAVRPLVTKELIDRCFKKMEEYDGVTPVLNVKETVYESDDGITFSRNLSRDRLFVGQTPEFFVFHRYLDANMRLNDEVFAGIRGSAQPAIMAGMKVAMVKGAEDNIKITTKEDLERYRAILES